MLRDFTDEHVMTEARKLLVPYALKRTLRYQTERDHSVHSESVAEHVFALHWLARYFLPLEDPEPLMDWQKVYDILLVHDFGEITHGDVPYHWKTAEHEAREREAAGPVFASLPGALAGPCRADWLAYETRSTPEARFAYALDKIEPLFELAGPINEQSMKRLRFGYDHHMDKKFRATEHFPIMRRFLEVMTADMLARGVFWVAEETGAA